MNQITNIFNIVHFAYAFKILFILFFSHMTFKKITNIQNNLSKFIFLFFILISIIATLTNIFYGSFYSIFVLLFLLIFVLTNEFELSIPYSILSCLISLSITFIFFFLALSSTYIIYVILNLKNYLLQLILIELIHYILIYLFFKIPRFKNGFNFLNTLDSNKIINYSLLIVCFIIIFIVSSYSDSKTSNILSYILIVFSIIMLFIIKNSITYYYKYNLLIKDLEETKLESIAKDKRIEELEQEIITVNKKSHSISHIQKSLSFKLAKLALNTEMANEIDFRSSINTMLSTDASASIPIPLTENSKIDDMLSYLQSECIENKIDFELTLSGNVHHILNTYMDVNSFEILLADLIRNSIIAVNYSENKNRSILVRIGLINGIYGVYIYDSGIEFNIDTLLNLGLKPCSSHLNDGGSGMGFMNIFDSLKESNSSLHISEIGNACLENYTKCIAIKFDNNHEYILDSYRIDKVEEIKNGNSYFDKTLCLLNKNT